MFGVGIGTSLFPAADPGVFGSFVLAMHRSIAFMSSIFNQGSTKDMMEAECKNRNDVNEIGDKESSNSDFCMDRGITTYSTGGYKVK